MRLDDYAAYGYSSNRREVAEYRHLDIDLREENGRVYVDKEQYMNVMGIKDIPLYSIPGDTSYIPYRETPDGELILYDINMEIGDRFLTVEGHDDIFVIRVDTISFLDDYGRQSDVKRKRIILNNGLFVIEGVGCINSPGGLLCYLNYGSDYWWNYPIGYLYKFNGTGVGIDTLQYNGFYEENPVIIKSQAVRKGMTWQVAVYDNDELSATSEIMETALHEYLDVAKYHHLLSKLDFIIDFVKVSQREYHSNGSYGEWMDLDFYVGQIGESYNIRNKDKVYCFSPSFRDSIRLLMDFSLTKGETAVCYRGENNDVEYVVEAVTDTVLPESTDLFRRKCLHVHNTSDPKDTDVWVEGIGSMKYGIMCWNVDDKKGRSALASCKQGDFVLMEDSTKIIQETTIIDEIFRERNKVEEDKGIFDLSGKKVDTERPNHIYISNGKKYLSK